MVALLYSIISFSGIASLPPCDYITDEDYTVSNQDPPNRTVIVPALNIPILRYTVQVVGCQSWHNGCHRLYGNTDGRVRIPPRRRAVRESI